MSFARALARHEARRWSPQNASNGVVPHRFFIIGACSALDTLASQAFGAGDRPGVICWAVASTVVLSLMAIPMAALLYIADSVADVVFQQPPEICEVRFPFVPCCATNGCNLSWCRMNRFPLWPYVLVEDEAWNASEGLCHYPH